MPRLLLLRHAKSSWDMPAAGSSSGSAVSDIERPLNPRGRKAAARMGQEIHAAGWTPDRVLCSPAVRARETLERMSETCAGIANIAIDPGLYHGTAADYVPNIQAGGKGATQLLVVGHNPLIHATAIHLAAGDDHPAVAGLVARYPTAALAVFDVTGSWADLSSRSARLAAFLLPRELENRPVGC